MNAVASHNLASTSAARIRCNSCPNSNEHCTDCAVGRNLHPVFQQALAPFLSPAYTHVYPTGLHCYEWAVSTRLTVKCFLDYEKAERGARDCGNGMAIEPDYPASMTLHSAYVGGQDIYDALSAVTVEEIEALALLGVQS